MQNSELQPACFGGGTRLVVCAQPWSVYSNSYCLTGQFESREAVHSKITYNYGCAGGPMRAADSCSGSHAIDQSPRGLGTTRYALGSGLSHFGRALGRPQLTDFSARIPPRARTLSCGSGPLQQLTCDCPNRFSVASRSVPLALPTPAVERLECTIEMLLHVERRRPRSLG